jgi:hypothetical protein
MRIKKMDMNDMVANVAATTRLAPATPISNPAFRYTPPEATDVMATFKKHGFVPPSRARQRQMAIALNGWGR